MADAAKAIETLLKENNAKLLRNSKNLVYQIPGLKEHFVMSKPKSRDAGHLTKNALSHLRRLLKTKESVAPSTIHSALRSAGLKSSTEQRTEVLVKTYSVRTRLAPPTPTPTPEPIEAQAPPLDLEQVKKENLERWSRSASPARLKHVRNGLPVRQATQEEIAEANRKLQTQVQEQPRQAWVPPVPVRMVGDEMIVDAPSVTFKSTEEEVWMNTAFVKQNIAMWRSQAAAKKAEAEELMSRATKLDDEQKALLEAVEAAERFVASLEVNGELLERKPPTAPTLVKHIQSRLPRGTVAASIISIIEEAGVPLGSGELKTKLSKSLNRTVRYGDIYKAVEQTQGKITKLPNVGYWLAGKNVGAHAASA